jgi:hypothetical protein
MTTVTGSIAWSMAAFAIAATGQQQIVIQGKNS